MNPLNPQIQFKIVSCKSFTFGIRIHGMCLACGYLNIEPIILEKDTIGTYQTIVCEKCETEYDVLIQKK